MKKILFIITFVYSQLGATPNFDICNTNDYITICNGIRGNINKINSKDKRMRLRAITQLSRLIDVLPSNRDSQTIKKILKRKVKQYNSIFGGKFFEVLAQSCGNGKTYFVEAYFDNYYNVRFREKEYNRVQFDGNNNLILDGIILPIPNQSKNRYVTALKGKMHSTQQLPYSNLNTDTHQICLTGTLNIRSIYKPYGIIAKVNENHILYDLGDRKKITITNKNGKKVTLTAMRVKVVDNKGRDTTEGYISANPDYQKPCN